MHRIIKSIACLFALSPLACGPGLDGEKGASTSIPPNRVSEPDDTAGKAPSRISCLAGAVMMVFGCSDAGELPDSPDAGRDLGTIVVTADASELQDGSGSPIMDTSRGDVRMPETTTSSDTGAMDGRAAMDSGVGGSSGSGGSGGSSAPVTREEAMSVMARLKAIPAGVVFVDNLHSNPEIFVSNVNVRMGKLCYVASLEGEIKIFNWTIRPDQKKLWSMGQIGVKAMTALTDAEIAMMQISRDPIPLSPPARGPLIPMSIEDWIRKNRANLDEAINNTEPDQRVICP